MHLLCYLLRIPKLLFTSRNILPGGTADLSTKTIWGFTLGIHQTLPSPAAWEHLAHKWWFISESGGFCWTPMCLFGFPSGRSLVHSCASPASLPSWLRLEGHLFRQLGRKWTPWRDLAALGCWEGLFVTKSPFPSVPSSITDCYSTSLLGHLRLSSFLMKDDTMLRHECVPTGSLCSCSHHHFLPKGPKGTSGICKAFTSLQNTKCCKVSQPRKGL